MRAGRQRYASVLWGLLVLCAGCLVDADEPCDENQVEINANSEVTGCVCAPDSVPNADGNGCVRCGEHEAAVSGACVCEDGYARPTPAEACEEIPDGGLPEEDAGEEPMDEEPTGVGESCATAADCAGYDATFCQNLQEPFECLLEGCAVGDVVCPETSVCCVIDVLPALEEANGLCVPPDGCMFGMVVTP